MIQSKIYKAHKIGLKQKIKMIKNCKKPLAILNQIIYILITKTPINLKNQVDMKVKLIIIIKKMK